MNSRIVQLIERSDLKGILVALHEDGTLSKVVLDINSRDNGYFVVPMTLRN